ncbi:MAG: hypothetical protein R3D43_09360 [Tepidamorphaceae bacterium]|nr:hypothetical protein [Rhodobiaceae bacterium]
MSLVSKSGSLRIACVAMMAFAVCMFAAPADAHMRDRSAYVVGTHFPYVSGYRYHPSGFWYSANLSGCRYPARYYRYRHNVGYVYVGPNHGYYRHHRVRHYEYRPRRHDYYRYHYRAQNRGIFTAHGGVHYKYRY